MCVTPFVERELEGGSGSGRDSGRSDAAWKDACEDEDIEASKSSESVLEDMLDTMLLVPGRAGLRAGKGGGALRDKGAELGVHGNERSSDA
jgi:hypothetical protein